MSNNVPETGGREMPVVSFFDGETRDIYTNASARAVENKRIGVEAEMPTEGLTWVTGTLRNVLENIHSEFPDEELVRLQIPAIGEYVVVQSFEGMKEVMGKEYTIKINKGATLDLLTGGMAGGGPKGQFIISVPSGERWKQLQEVNDKIKKAAKVETQESISLMDKLFSGKNEINIENGDLRKIVFYAVMKSVVPGYSPYNKDGELDYKKLSEDNDRVGLAIQHLTSYLLPLVAAPDTVAKVALHTIIKPVQNEFEALFDDIFLKSYLEHYKNKGATDGGMLDDLFRSKDYNPGFDIEETLELLENGSYKTRKNDRLKAFDDNMQLIRATSNLILEGSLGSTILSIVNTLYQSSRYPDLMQMINNDIDNGGKERMVQSTFLAGCMHDPAVWITFRQVTENVQFRGYDLKPRERVILSLREALKDTSAKFFNEEGHNVELMRDMIKQRSPLVFAPWLSFPTNDEEFQRECSGKNFAIMVGMQICEYLWSNFEMEKSEKVANHVVATGGMHGRFSFKRKQKES